MSLLKYPALFGTLALISKVSAHGIVTGVVADGKYFQGYDPSFQYQQNPPEVAGWTAPLTQNRGFVDPPSYGSPDIICHKGATPGKGYIQVSAGGTIELQWTEWPVSHHGPMLDYLAPCGDDCTTVDKTSLKFTKIDEAGMNEWVTQPGDWASDDMIKNNNTWVTTIPSSIAPGKYVLRHETIALHAANNPDGAQNYPQCMNIEVSGSGTNDLSSGTLGTELYTATDPGVLVNIYYPKLESYVIPGPPVMQGGSSGSPAPAPSSSKPADISVTAKPTTGIAIPTGEPSLPPYPVSDNSTVPAPTGSSSSPSAPSATESHPWADWSYTNSFSSTKPATGIAIPTGSGSGADVPADTAAPAPTAGAGEGEGDGAGPSPPLGGGQGDGGYPSPPNGGGKPEAPEKPETPAPATTSPPVSFSSTVTGRIGKPTKFVCYLEED
jgi:lytic cellulose monooxygenase (C1-hydroxylating)